MQEPNISPYRRAVCGDLTTVFNFKTPNLLPVAELDGKKTKAEADAIRIAQALLPQVPVRASNNFLSRKWEFDHRVLLPYILHTSAKVDVTQKRLN